MPSWRCPYCRTPQAETARCWVCLRSTTTCATCRHYRRGISTGLGLCGLDRRRVPLRGTEVRACWVGASSVAPEPDASGAPRRAAPAPEPVDAASRPHRTFVPVDDLAARADAEAVTPVPPRDPAREPGGRWSLWGDAEP